MCLNSTFDTMFQMSCITGAPWHKVDVSLCLICHSVPIKTSMNLYAVFTSFSSLTSRLWEVDWRQ